MSTVRLQLYEEEVSPTGGQKAEGAKRVLGTPSMGQLTVVLREAVQNSWDARVGDHVQFTIRHYCPNAEQKRALVDRVLDELPPASNIKSWVQPPQFAMLVFSDKGTSGLNGPIAANIPAEPGQRRNFVDFVFEIGRDPTRGVGGGTYGFGKSSFFQMSRISTVLVHTRCLSNGAFEERLIVAYLGTSVAGRTTGRAWWGRPGQRHPEPLTGTDAAALARDLGLPEFVGDECGTSVAVLSPGLLFEDAARPFEQQVTEREVIASLGNSMVQWFWPKMLPTSDGRPAIEFKISYGNIEIAVPNPSTQSPYRYYVEALQAVETFRSTNENPPAGEVIVISSLRPKAVLGYLCLLRRPKGVRIQMPADFEEESAKRLADQAHHIALLREPRLVVKYLPGLKPPSEAIDVVGVFIVDEKSEGGEVERAFALSEPPVHDDWVPAALENPRLKSFVNVAFKRITEHFNNFVQPFTDSASIESAQPGLGAFSEMMGGLIASTTGTGARAQPPNDGGGGGGGGGGGRLGKPRVVATEGRLEHHATYGVVLAVPFSVVAAGPGPFSVNATASVLLEGSAEREPPEGADAPEIRAFERRHRDGSILETRTLSSLPFVPPPEEESWYALASIPADARVRVSITVDE